MYCKTACKYRLWNVIEQNRMACVGGLSGTGQREIKAKNYQQKQNYQDKIFKNKKT